MKCQNCGKVVPIDADVVYCAYCGAKLEKPWEKLATGLERAKLEMEAIDQATHVDPKIKDMVIGLKRWGINTEMSCEGHLYHGASFPWVDVPYEQAEKLARVVSWQNRPKLPDGTVNKNTWVIRPGASLRLIPEDKNCSLKTMQEDAIEFGKFLQELPDD